jgi:hypothetical protein
MMDDDFVKFIYRINNDFLYVKEEDIVDIEYLNRKLLWNLPKETVFKTYKKDEDGNFNVFGDIPLSNLRMISYIDYGNDNKIEYREE